MSQTENTPDLGAMISQLLADPQRMQQLGQMAASLGLGAPAQSSSNETASCGGLPDLSAVLGAAPRETKPAIDPSLLLKLQSAMQSLSQPSPGVELLQREQEGPCVRCARCSLKSAPKRWTMRCASCSWSSCFPP